MSYNFYYLATVYRKHPDGLDAAAEEAARYAALFIDAGVPVFAPVPHSHPIARYTSIPHRDPRWLQLQLPFMEAARGMILMEMQNWRESEGIAFERNFFQKVNRPVYRVSIADPVGEFTKMSGGTCTRLS